MLGTVVVAGTSPESIQVLIPDCTIPPVDQDTPVAYNTLSALSAQSALSALSAH